MSRNKQLPLKECFKFIDEIYAKKVQELELLESYGTDHLEMVMRRNDFLERCFAVEKMRSVKSSKCAG